MFYIHNQIYIYIQIIETDQKHFPPNVCDMKKEKFTDKKKEEKDE